MDPRNKKRNRNLRIDAPRFCFSTVIYINFMETNFNNSIVLGSVVGWLALFLPIVALSWWLVALYRRTWGAKVKQTSFYKALAASKAYNFYRMFEP